MNKFAPLLIMVLMACTTEAEMNIRIVTYNIHHGEGADGVVDLDRIAAIIADQKPDIVCLQEVDQNLPRTQNRDFPSLLIEKLNMQGVFEPNYLFDGGRYGNMTLSRLPIKEHENTPLPNPGGKEPRGILRTTIDVNGTLIDVFNTHMGLEPKERLAQASFIVTRFRDRPTILAGDLNATTEEPPLQVLQQKLRDLSPPEQGSGRRIDHVLISESFTPVSAEIVMTEPAKIASDHHPVVVEVKLSRKDTVSQEHGILNPKDARIENALTR